MSLRVFERIFFPSLSDDRTSRSSSLAEGGGERCESEPFLFSVKSGELSRSVLLRVIGRGRTVPRKLRQQVSNFSRCPFSRFCIKKPRSVSRLSV